jgi:DNA helicase-2/ATP-dependent DNA helicase PcrA
MKTARKLISDLFPGLNDAQKEAIFHIDGPTLIIAGQGTGKTYTLVLRTLYLLLSERAAPSEIVLTTFTEKSAFELRDRLSQFSKILGVKLNLHELITGTIHSICDTFISQNIKHTPLKKNYIVLDELTGALFINEHFDKIVLPFKLGDRYFGRWLSKWDTNARIKAYFDKLTEEIIEPDRLIKSKDDFLRMLGESYKAYRHVLFDNNKVDFAFQQRIFFDLLANKSVNQKITSRIKYLLIDEYQDTNYIQEQIALKLVKPHNNICVVGDEDQSLYRFRGSTVRNILEYPGHFEKCRIIKLLENYRSHKTIIETYNAFIDSIDWSNSDGTNQFRYPDKKVIPSSQTVSPQYPAVFSIWASSPKDEAERFADLVEYLKKNKIIEDYSDVALLLRSVKLEEYSGHFIEALRKRNIRAFCPRARAYFENDEVKITIACYALLLGFLGSDLQAFEHQNVIEEGITMLGPYQSTALAAYLKRMSEKINNLKGNETLDENVSDFLYQLFAYKPFSEFLKDENKARNLSIFSSLLSAFQTYYHIPVVSAKNKVALKYKFFNSFINLLLNTGQNEYEDENNPIPKGYVQIMTIHQSKGLEFPVVVVGTLDKQYSVQKDIDRRLGTFYRRPAFEPEHLITKFDWARCYYVAFSRPQKLLVLTTSTEPKEIFRPVWEGLNQWPYVKKETLKAQKFKSKSPFIPKKTLSLTSHINVYETCPRQYQFYKELDFTPSRTGQVLFGTLVHQTIEDIHSAILDGDSVSEKMIADNFENNYKGLLANGFRPIGIKQKEEALKHVIIYFKNNKDIFKRIIETEVDVSVEKDNYIISGKVDLLLGKDQRLEVLDFKSQPRPDAKDPMIERYKKQLNLYAYILKERHKKDPERLYIYWTSEELRKNALMEIEYDDKLVEEAGRHFDDVANCIINKDFAIKEMPDKTKTCKECDIRFYCYKGG